MAFHFLKVRAEFCEEIIATLEIRGKKDACSLKRLIEIDTILYWIWEQTQTMDVHSAVIFEWRDNKCCHWGGRGVTLEENMIMFLVFIYLVYNREVFFPGKLCLMADRFFMMKTGFIWIHSKRGWCRSLAITQWNQHLLHNNMLKHKSCPFPL